MYFTLCLVGKLKSCRTLTGSAASTHAIATALNFPANAGLFFLTDELTHDKYLVDTGATLSIVPCTSKTTPSGPLLKGADGQPFPSWGFFQQTVQFHGKLFSSQFLQAAKAGTILGIDFVREFKVTVALETSTASPPSASPDQVHQVKPTSFGCQGNQSIKNPPPPFC